MWVLKVAKMKVTGSITIEHSGILLAKVVENIRFYQIA